jgi:hypothetical protein
VRIESHDVFLDGRDHVSDTPKDAPTYARGEEFAEPSFDEFQLGHCTVQLVVVRPSPRTLLDLDRKARLAAVRGLDPALLVDTGPHPLRLQATALPDAADRRVADTERARPRRILQSVVPSSVLWQPPSCPEAPSQGGPRM